MDLQIAGKRALVVGGSKGIGYAIARRLVHEGARVTIVARSAPTLAQAREAIKQETGREIATAVADVTKPASLEGAVVTAADQGVLDILVTNHGGPPTGDALNQSDDQWHAAFEQVVMSTIWTIRAALSPLSKADTPAIACINSYIFREPSAGRALSNVPRAGLTALIKTLAIELAADNIRINNVCPGPIWTERSQQLMSSAAARAGTTVDVEKRKLIENRLLVKRYGQPDDVADAVAFLVSPRASYITGANIPIDGGMIRSLL